MGNGQTISQEAKDRFATIELECIQDRFEQLAREGSFRGQSFPAQVFKRHYLTDYPEIADMIFHAFDCDGNAKLDLHEFIDGISHCTRGTREEKLSFVFDMFDQNRSKTISRKEFCSGIHSSLFAADGKETDVEKTKRIQKAVDKAFTFDADNDGYLNKSEFLAWSEEAPEAETLVKLFQRMDDELTQNTNEAVAEPFHVCHDVHVGMNDDGLISIDNIPDSWVRLFKEAGASEDELKDPAMVMKLMTIVAEKLTQKAGLSDGGPTPPRAAPAAPATTGVPDAAAPAPAKAPATPEPSKTTAVPDEAAPAAPATPTPAESAPPAPAAPAAPATPEPTKDADAPAPPAPPAPPAVPEGGAPPVQPSSGNLLAEIKQGVDLEHAETVKHESNDPNDKLLGEIQAGVKLQHVEPKKREAPAPANPLIGEIQKGVKLRHVDPADCEKLEPVERDDLTSQLAAAIKSHRAAMNLPPAESKADNWE